MERQLGNVATASAGERAGADLGARSRAGGESAVHRHDLDYIIVQIEGDRIAGKPEPDTAGAFREYLEADVEPGRTRFIARGGIETAINVGQRRYREILIELK